MRPFECAHDARVLTSEKIVAVVLSITLFFSLPILSVEAFAQEKTATNDVAIENVAEDEGIVGEAVESKPYVVQLEQLPGDQAVDEAQLAISEEGPISDEATIADDENPLAAFDTPQCWVHIFMILGIIATAIYGAVVVLRRLGHARKIDKFDNDITGMTNDAQALSRNQGVAHLV